VRYEARERFYEGRTKSAEAWPLPNTRYVPLYVDVTKQMLQASALTAPGSASYDSTVPNTAGGSAVFTHRFDGDTELTGTMKLKLWVSTDGDDDLDLFVGIRKRDRRGKELHFADFNHIEHGLVARGWLRASHRELDEARSTPYQPWLRHQRALKLKPGEIVPVEIEIWPSSTLFGAGEMLELTVQGGSFTYTQSNPLPIKHGRICTGHDQTINRGRHVIHAGGTYDSHLLVPVIP
jgi:predicted acyl esterase